MINKDDKLSVIRAKQNEVRGVGLQDYYDNTQRYDAVKVVYPNDSKYDDIVSALRRTTKPKYIKFASLLNYLSKTINVERDQALVLLDDAENKNREMKDKQVMTLYREFQKIKKKAMRLDDNQTRALNKYKDVRKFIISGDVMIVQNKLHESKLNGSSTYEEYTRFFDDLNELKFLETSKLTKHVR